MIIVIDTNIWIILALFPKSGIKKLVDKVIKNHRTVRSKELTEALYSSKFDKYLGDKSKPLPENIHHISKKLSTSRTLRYS